MANEHQIRRVFSDLGELFGAEHSEHDDEGAQMVHGLIKRLRKFARHEQQEREGAQASNFRRGLLEAAYGSGGTKVWYDNGDAIRDVTDLYTVLPEQHSTGSPNLENMQARGLLEHLQRGGGLGEAQIGLLRGLLGKHGAAVERLRQSRDRDGQDLLNLPDASANTRIITRNGAP